MMLRKLLAWLVGIAVFLALGMALTWAGSAFGVPSSIDLDGPTTITHGSGRYSYDEDTESSETLYGLVTGALSIIVGLWAGRAIYARSWRAGFSERGLLTLWAWIMALAILAALSVLTYLAFRSFHGRTASYARMFIELGSAAGIAWACYQWWKNRVSRLTHGTTSGR
ncbi:hypothetical protein [Cupriavidus sp. IK-TO18]|jgi:hypothetical protein|uniref:hypothetical protein n=1 Tax=Cupriavidus sp. IK-TO18 TaxID=2782182 RepID=UPI00189A2D27|nr:hypothetical protein [Cupriavidus sp. IK-TO18]MBF6989295.1 hypothetical protein [Cupriavidus sp. IK-TO18]